MERTGRTVSSRRFFLPRKRASGMHRLSYTFTIHILRACIMHQLPKVKPRRKGYDLFCVQSSGESYSTTTETERWCVCGGGGGWGVWGCVWVLVCVCSCD